MTATPVVLGGYQIELPEVADSGERFRPLGLRIEQTVQMHDLATVRVRSFALDWYSVLAPGSPIKIRYGSMNGGTREFVGYINYIRPILKHDDYYDFDIIAAGASKILRTTAARTWKARTVPEIVSEVAREFRLNPIVEPHSLRRPTTAMRGESYWEFLSDLTLQIGFGLWADGVNLYAASIGKLATESKSNTPVVTAFGFAGMTDAERENASPLLSFKTNAGLYTETGPYTGNQALSVAVAPVGNTNSGVTKAPKSGTKRKKVVTSSYVKPIKGKVSHSRLESDLLAAGAAENGMLAIDGHLVCGGHSSIRPYSLIYLDTQDYSASGYWIVKSVTHEFPVGDHTHYQCQATVSTDSLAPSTDSMPTGLRTINPYDLAGRGPLRGSRKSAQARRERSIPVEGKTSDLVNAFRWVAV